MKNRGLLKKVTALDTLYEHWLKCDPANYQVVGNVHFAALAAHLPSKRYLIKDDVEALLYVCSYLGKGKLPWTKFRGEN